MDVSILVTTFITSPPVGWWGIVFARFLCFFVSLSATLREKSWTDLHEIFREGVEWPWDALLNFGSIRVNGSAGQRSIYLLSKLLPVELDISFALAWWQQGAGFVVPRHHSLLFLFLLLLLLHPTTNRHNRSWQSRTCALSDKMSRTCRHLAPRSQSHSLDRTLQKTDTSGVYRVRSRSSNPSV